MMPGSDQAGLLLGGVERGELQLAAAAGGCRGLLLATAAAAGSGARAAAAAVKLRRGPGPGPGLVWSWPGPGPGPVPGLPALVQAVHCHSLHQRCCPVH